ncbi:MAG: hypothetical protein LBS81_03670 [Endomicrobium sp.]|nr:hypothetical protein [Endomicrobium sp.]
MSNKKNISFRLHGGIRAGIEYTNGFCEKGSSAVCLDVKRNIYSRMSMRAGAGLIEEGRRFRRNASLGMDCLAAGNKAEIEGRFVRIDEKFKSRSVKEEIFSAEGNMGGDIV